MTIWSRIKAFLSGWPESQVDIELEKAEKQAEKLKKDD